MKYTLHEAIEVVLRRNSNRWMNVREIAEEVNQRKLYARRNGSNVDSGDIHSRVNDHSDLFEKSGVMVRLRQWRS